MTIEAESTIAHYAKHGGDTTWCGGRVSELCDGHAGQGDQPCQTCLDNIRSFRAARSRIRREKLAEAGVTPGWLDQRAGSVLTPDTPTPSWWAAHGVGYRDGLDGRYNPRSAVQGAHGYDAGHADGENDQRIRRAYDEAKELADTIQGDECPQAPEQPEPKAGR